MTKKELNSKLKRGSPMSDKKKYLNSKLKIQNSKLSANADKRLLMSHRLDTWAEITALALDLQRSASALKKNEWTDTNVWRKTREMKEKAWTTDHC